MYAALEYLNNLFIRGFLCFYYLRLVPKLRNVYTIIVILLFWDLIYSDLYSHPLFWQHFSYKLISWILLFLNGYAEYKHHSSSNIYFDVNVIFVCNHLFNFTNDVLFQFLFIGGLDIFVGIIFLLLILLKMTRTQWWFFDYNNYIICIHECILYEFIKRKNNNNAYIYIYYRLIKNEYFYICNNNVREWNIVYVLHFRSISFHVSLQ